MPTKPVAAFTPSMVPEVDHAVEVVPEGSTRNWGLFVVLDPAV